MVEAYVNYNIWDAFKKADGYFEDLNRRYGKSKFFQSVSLVWQDFNIILKDKM